MRRAGRRQTIIRHIERLGRYQGRLQAHDRRFFWLRLGTLLGGGVLVFLAYLSGESRWIWAAVGAFAAAFGTVIYFHRRLDRDALRARLSHEYWAAQLARLDLDWEGIPRSTAPDAPAEHPFARDLDLVGERSVHRLLDTSASQGGSRRLSDWLLTEAPNPAVIRERQAAVQELVPLAGFRSRLGLNSAYVGARPGERWDGEALLAWLERHGPGRSLARPLWALAALAILNAALFVLSSTAGLPPAWIISLALYIMLYFAQSRALEDTFEVAQHLALDLEKFRAVLRYLERYPYPPGSRLARLGAPFWQASRQPSRLLRRLAWIASAAGLRGNPIVWMLLNLLAPWDLFVAHALEGAKTALSARLPAWVDAWYELEALNSLANFAGLSPGAAFPALLVGNPGEPIFAGRGLGHPLLPEPGKVRNDLEIQRLGQVLLITGSNMSGKSTFLRTLGVNLALAYAGGVVDATELRVIPMRLFTTINVSDSLTDGISYFYAEVRRLKRLLDALREETSFPLFFLIDEIFRGTNNRERQIGSRAYVQALAGGRGVGAISTHDLELVHLADELPQVVNLHFREEVRDGRLLFDYKLHPGPSPTTNALKIMALEGLPVLEKLS